MDGWLKQQPLKKRSSSDITTVSTETTKTVTPKVCADLDSNDDNKKHKKIRQK